MFFVVINSLHELPPPCLRAGAERRIQTHVRDAIRDRQMKLRTLILIFLIVVGLTPVAAVVALNLPMVLDRLGLWVQRAHLQNLRLEFGDLHRYLASREEMVRFLANLPPLSPEGETTSTYPPDSELQFTDWINHTLRSGPEIFRVVYLDRAGREYYRLERRQVGAELKAAPPNPDADYTPYFRAAISMQRDGVYFSPLEFAPADDTDALHPMVIRLATPIFGSDEQPRGVVLVNIDAGGLAYAYPDNLWALDDGRYLPSNPRAEASTGSALEDFPGLGKIMAQPQVAILEDRQGNQVIWMPLFPTQSGGSLWVGRRVDPTDMDAFRTDLIRQVVIIVMVLIVVVLVVARWLGLRAERFGAALTENIRRVLDGEQGVVFAWRGPRELQDLGRELTRLADAHATNTRNLIARAAELEASNRYKSEFLANMSHELRTPLNSIILLSKLLAANDTGNLTEEQRQQARVINAAGNDLATLINDILDLSKIEARRTSIYLRDVDPAALCRGLVELIGPQVHNKGLGLDLVVEEQAPASLETDEDKLRQILKNFLANAVKFTDRGGITVTVGRNRAGDADERPLAISVHDTGIGIPPSQHEMVFEPFRQVDGSTNRRHGGTGLGLAISNELAKLMGGRIELDSDTGLGTTFTLLLPLTFDTSGLDAELFNVHREGEGEEGPEPAPPPVAAPPPRAAAAPAAAEPGGAGESREFRGRRVLLVDDDVRELLRLTPLLEGWGMEVTAAGSLEEALQTLDSDAPFEVALMDMHLPELQGAGGLERLHGHPAGAGLPVVAILAADADPALREYCEQAGACTVLPGPTPPEALRAALRTLLGQ
ncbi:signal transduction histidine kinase [Thioalbus denitrificans]|uniref:histidine kinase n=2 Tax=Thioalbus denitrificans TaxID=547122 RepID=A0A369BWA0_9GAMM|nr:signal transduction histidine kinase [Thioalbus denitrificans]